MVIDSKIKDSLKIRLATSDDYEILCGFREKLLEHQHRVNPKNIIDENKIENSKKLIKTYFTRNYSFYYIAFILDNVSNSEIPVGFIHVTIDPKPQEKIQAYIQDLFVNEEYRCKGIGESLLNKAHELFLERDVRAGLTTDYTSKNKDTLNFYLDRGYRVLRIEDDVVYMVQEKVQNR